MNESLNKFEDISTEDDIEGYRLLDIQTLIKFISLSPCTACLSKIKTGRTEAIKPLYKFSETLVGISSVVKITCEHCDDDRIFRVERPGENLNIRFQHAMYSICINQEKSNRFLANMNMPKSVSSKTCLPYTDILSTKQFKLLHSRV